MLTQKYILVLLTSLLTLSISLSVLMFKYFNEDMKQTVSLAEADEKCVHQANEKEMGALHKHSCSKAEVKLVKSEENNEAKEKNSVLKSGSNLVTVFYVLLNYLFSTPFESQSLQCIK